jgi:hypothetical protein
MLTNKILADSLDIPLTRIRRWAKEYLPPDPKATRQSGYLREYSDKDGWFLYVSGMIMEATGFTFRKTQKLMEEKLKPWMLRVGLAPDNDDLPILKGADAYIRYDCKLYFYINEQSDDKEIPPVRVEGLIEIPSRRKKTDEGGKEFAFINETKITYWVVEPLTKKSARDYFFRGPVPAVPIYSLLSNFITWVFGDDRSLKWHRNWGRIHPESELRKALRTIKWIFTPIDNL